MIGFFETATINIKVMITEEDIRKMKEEGQLKKCLRDYGAESKKVGQLIDLCCDLIPTPIVDKITLDCQRNLLSFKETLSIKENRNSKNETLSDIFLDLFYSILEFNTSRIIIAQYTNDYSSVIIASGSIQIPNSIANDYDINIRIKYSIEDYCNSIKKHKKCNRYTSALIETIYFLLTSHEIVESILKAYSIPNNYNIDYPKKIEARSLFNVFNTICDLFIEIGAIDSALKLYSIDEAVLNTPNRLSLLADKVVQSGNFADSVKLVGKLIEQEPFHPAIPTIQAEIKRLEQRHRLKATFSIDFSKVDELSGVEFENLLMDKFSSLGFKVESTPKTGDFGADLIVENSEGSRIIVQCKRFKSKVNLKAVQEVVGAMGHYAGDMGIVITNNSFLNSAVKLAESHDIELWDGDKLVSFLAGDLSFSETINT